MILQTWALYVVADWLAAARLRLVFRNDSLRIGTNAKRIPSQVLIAPNDCTDGIYLLRDKQKNGMTKTLNNVLLRQSAPGPADFEDAILPPTVLPMRTTYSYSQRHATVYGTATVHIQTSALQCPHPNLTAVQRCAEAASVAMLHIIPPTSLQALDKH